MVNLLGQPKAEVTMKTQEAIRFYGSGAALAAALGITPGAISMWGEEPPRIRQIDIENLSGGKLKAAKAFSTAQRTIRSRNKIHKDQHVTQSASV